MKGLEIGLIKLSAVRSSTSTARFDPEYFQKQHLADAAVVELRPSDFSKLADIRVSVDASAFYPSIEEYYGEGDFPFYRVGDVDGLVDVNRALRIPRELCDQFPTLKRVSKGDILFTKGGAIDRVGYVVEPGAVTRDLIFLKTSILPEDERIFLFSYFRTDFFRRMLLRSSSQTTQPHLTITLVRELPIYLGNAELRRAVLEMVRRSYQLIEKASVRLLDAEERLAREMGLPADPPVEPLAYTSPARLVSAAGRLDAQYFMPVKIETIAALSALPGVTLGDVFESIREIVDPTKHGSLGLVRNFDVTDALEPVLDDEQELVDFAEVGSTKKRMRESDVAVSRLRSYLREIAIVRCSAAYPTVGSTEFIVLRPKKKDCPIAPETLMTFLRSQPVQTILKWCQDGSQHPRFSEKDLLAIPLPDAVAAASPQIEAFVVDALAAREEARKLTSAAKRAVEIAVEDSEAAALRFLDDMEG